MAWFHKTLTDMLALAKKELKKPKGKQDWKEFIEILEQHQQPWDEHIARAAFLIKEYKQEMDQLTRLITKPDEQVMGTDQTDVVIKIRKAIDVTEKFEEIMLKLIADRKFME